MQSKAPSARAVLEWSVRNDVLRVPPVGRDRGRRSARRLKRAQAASVVAAGAGVARAARPPAARRRTKSSMPVAPTASKARVDLLRVLEQAQVAARLEQVGADRDGAQAAGEQVGHVEGSRRRRRTRAAVALELVRDPGREVDGHRVERPAREVHRRVAVEDAAPVVAPRACSTASARRRRPAPPAAARSRSNIGTASSQRRSWPKASSGIGHVAEPELLVHDARAPAPRPAASGCTSPSCAGPRSSIRYARDPLDLVGRAAVHRRERHGVGDAGRDVDLADAGKRRATIVDVRRQPGRRVGHRVEVPLDVGLGGSPRGCSRRSC